MAQTPGYNANSTSNVARSAAPAAQPCRHRHLRARLDLQAGHDHRRALGRLVTPSTRFTLPYRYQFGRCCAVLGPRRRVPPDGRLLGRADPRVLLERRRGHDRREARRRTGSPAWIERFGFGSLTGIDFPGESPGFVLPLDQWSETDDRQRADRAGDLGHADPDGLGLRGGRERRRLDPAPPRRAASAAARPRPGSTAG